LNQPYRPGGWTPAQLINHVADSHAMAIVRIKFGLTEDFPTVPVYNQRAWSELADGVNPDLEPSLQMLDGIQPRLATLFRSLDAEALARPLNHPDKGRMTVDQLLSLYAWHGHHHIAVVRNALGLA